VLPFWYWLTWVVPDKGPLNGCLFVSLTHTHKSLSCLLSLCVVIAYDIWKWKMLFFITRNVLETFLLFYSAPSVLLVGRQEEHPACKKLSDGVLLWLSVWSEVQTVCIWST